MQQEPQNWYHILQPPKGWNALNLREIWEYHELLYFLMMRDISVRYKQTFLGAAWAIIQPLMTMLVFSVFFGRLAGVPSDNVPYPIFAYAGLLPWTFFASALLVSANSLVDSSNLISKVYFPRLLIPIASTLAGVVDFAIAFVLLLIMMVAYGITPDLAIVFVPLSLLLALLAALGISLWLSALNVMFRDVRYAVPFLVQFLMFATPIAYPSSLLDEPWRTLYGINPMVGAVESFRWALIGTPPPGNLLLLSIAVTLVLFIGGILFFRRMEDYFADII